jgi:acetolactate synthase-1/2/3 large subunit
VASSGVRFARAWGELLEFAETCQIPVITTYTGKGVFPEDHPLSLGCQGRCGSIPAIRATQECDLVIAVGTRFTDFDTGAWTVYNIPGQTRLVHIDIDVGEIARVYPTEVGIVADARLGLRALLAELGPTFKTSRIAPWVRRVQGWKEDFEPKVRSIGQVDTSPVHYARLCYDLSQVVNEIDPDSIVYFDASNVLSFAPVFFPTRSRNFGTDIGHWARLGWGVPAIMGAKLAQPQHPAIGVVGDGAFMMRATAMATAVEQGIPCVWIVLNNRMLQIERDGMMRHYERESFCTFYRRDTGQPWNPDFVLMARSMGVEAEKVERPEQLRPALTRAIEANCPYLLDVEIDTTVKPWRPLWYRYPHRFEDPPRQAAAAVIDYTANGYISP